jgi:hypothetical protein
MQKIGQMARALGLASIVALVGVLGSAQLAAASGNSGVIASFDGGVINLSQGWGSATVCAVTSAGTDCFASQSAYNAWASAIVPTTSLALPVPSVNCSTGLKLFQSVNYGGSELVLYVQASWINLSAYGFAGAVSSYQVGACTVGMAASTNGSGAAYPGATSPDSDVPTMGSAWNDRVQSVYIV